MTRRNEDKATSSTRMKLRSARRTRSPERWAKRLATPSGVGPFPPTGSSSSRTSYIYCRRTRAPHSGAAGWLRPRFGGVRVTAGVEVIDAGQQGERVAAKFVRGSAIFDYIVLATGYSQRLPSWAPILCPRSRAVRVHQCCLRGSN
jgi:hypothetical protein